jgi:hypothetical protein
MTTILSGWWLSMNHKDSFLQKIQPIKDIHSLLDQQSRFKADPGPSKTIGCLIVSSTIMSVPYLLHMFIRRAWRYQREVIRIRESNKDRQHNDRKKKDKKTNNDLQKKTTQKTKDRATRTPLKTVGWAQVLRKSKAFSAPLVASAV